MLVAFDTSVVVAALREAHLHHLEPWLARAMTGDVPGVLPAQVLAEAYSALTANGTARVRAC